MGALIIDAHYKLIAHILGNAMLSILLLWLRRRETLGVFCLLHSLVPRSEMKCTSVMHRIDVWICQGTTN